MRLTRVLGVGLAAAFLLGSLAWAQEREQPRQRRVQRGQRLRRRGVSLAEFVQQALKEVKATEEQELRIKQILDTYRQANENLLREQGDVNSLREQWRKAREANDREALQRLREQMRQLARQRRSSQVKACLEVLGVLEGQQKEKFVELALRRRLVPSQADQIRLVLGALDVPKPKLVLAEKILQRAQADEVRARGRRGAIGARGQVIRDIKAKVLTPQQAEKFDQLLRRGRPDPYAGLDLTAEQREQIEKIRAEAREKMSQADPEQRREIFREAMRKIREEVLTPEQREKQAKLRAGRARGRRGRRGRRPGREGPGQDRPREGE